MYVNWELPTQKFAAAGAYCGMKVNMNKAHKLLAHMKEDSNYASVKALG